MTILTTKRWTNNSPEITMTYSYEKQRVGSDMQYRIKIDVAPLTNEAGRSFGFPIQSDIILDGTTYVKNYILKNSTPSNWSNTISYTTDWITIENKVVGNTALTIRMYSSNGSTRNELNVFSLPVDGSPSRFTLSSNEILLDNAQLISFTIDRDSSSFTHTLRVSLNNKFVEYKNLTTNGSFKLPLDWNNEIPNSDTHDVLVTLYTYANNQLIGTTSKQILAKVPENILPSIESLNVVKIDNQVPPSWNFYIQNQSGVNVQIVGASGSYGSTITNYYLVVGRTVSTSSSITVSKIPLSGTNIILGRVTDSRGRVVEMTTSIPVLSYQIPQFGETEIYRSDVDGTRNDEGESITIYPKITYNNYNNLNAISVKLYRKLTTEDNYSNMVTVDNNVPTTIWENEINKLIIYDVKIVIEDEFSQVETFIEVSTSKRLMRLVKPLYSVGFGGNPQFENSVEIIGDMKLIEHERQVYGQEVNLWTPTSPNNSILISNILVNHFVKNGNLVTIQGRFNISKSSTSNRIEIGGLPFEARYDYALVELSFSGRVIEQVTRIYGVIIGDKIIVLCNYINNGANNELYLLNDYILESGAFNVLTTYIVLP